MDTPSQTNRRILFVCTGNTCRSPMAAALFQSIAAEKGLSVDIASAGTAATPGASASPVAQRVLARRSLDLMDHSSKSIFELGIHPGDLILTMTRRHRDMLLRARPELGEQTHVLKEYVGAAGQPDVDDPFGGSDTEYEACYEQLYELLLKLAERLKEEIGK